MFLIGADNYEYDIENIDLMQFTGLHDKNGVKIDEGDILKSESELFTHFGKVATGEFDETYREVKWLLDSWGTVVLKSKTIVAGAESKGLKVNSEYGEVIGNIHQNPELMETSK